MGGKNKQSQRTKNNVRPSSSGRSAELLSSAGKFDASMATVGGKLMPALFPTLAAVSLDAGLDPELAMCIKKLNKKDPITKTKALQELTELVNKSSVEDVEAALPGWTHFYKTLSVDIDCKVRECTQVCHGAIVRVCGRRIAPHLKQLLPSWLQAQYDDHAPAQAQAQLSLKNTFPDAKLPEVIAFCKTEILDFLEDNLTGKSAIAAAAGEGDGGRGGAAALHGLAWSSRHAPPALHDWLAERLAKLLANDAFWRLAAHKECSVRAAWFAAMGSIVERLTTSLDVKHMTRLLRVLLGAREADTRVAAQLWGCLLVCMHRVPDWHACLDKKDLLAKRILNLLETGGWGDAKQLSSTLLPLLASLPPEMLTNQFYEQFFKAIFAGLEKKSVINSKSERQAWITGLSECVRYLSTQPVGGCIELCSAAQRQWLDSVLSRRYEKQLVTGLLKHSAQLMTELLKYWLRRASEEGGERYATLVRNFWQNIGATVFTQSENISAETAAMTAQRHVLLLTTVRHSLLQDQRKQHSIRFDGDDPPPAAPVSPYSVLDAANTQLFHHQFNAAVEQLCSRYLELARDTRAPSLILPSLSPLLSTLTRDAILSIAQRLDANTIYGLFESLLLPWLMDEETRCEAVMDFVFQLLAHMSEEEQDATFAAFTQEQVCTWALWRSLSHPHVSLRAARRWLRGAAVSRAVSQAARSLHSGRQLLLLAITPADDDEMLVSEETVTSVVGMLADRLATDCSEQLSSVLSQLASTLAQRPPDNYRALLLALFRLTLTQHLGSGQLSSAAWLEARSAWQDGLLALPEAPRDALRHDATQLLLRHALPDTTLEDLDIPSIEHAACLCPYLLSECEHTKPSSAVETEQLLQQLLQPAKERVSSAAALDVFALRHDCIVGRLSCPFADDNDAIAMIVTDCDKEDVEELTKEDLVLRLTELMFRALCLRTLLLHRPDEDDDATDKADSWCGVLLATRQIREQFCELLRDYVVLDSLHDGYAFWPHYDIIERAKSKLDVALQDIIDETPLPLRQTILLELSERAAKEGYYWSYARSCYEAKSTDRSEDQSDVKSDAGSLMAVNMDNLAEVITGNGLYHSLQANLRWLPSPPPTETEEGSPASSSLRTAHVVMLRAAMAALEAEEAPLDIRQQFARDAVAAAQDGNASPDVMVDLYYRHEKVMLGERDPQSVSWQTVCCSAATARYLSLLVCEHGWHGKPHHWDFATISLCALLAALKRPICTKTAMLCVSSLQLLDSVRAFIADLPAECERRQPAPHVAALIDEWKDIFAPDVYTNLFSLIMKILDDPPSGPTSCIMARTLSALTTSARALQWNLLPGALRAETLSLQSIAGRAASALAATTHRGYKYLAHATLCALATDLVLEDADKLAAWSERSSVASDESEQQPPPSLSLTYFHSHYRSLLELLDVALANIQVGESSCEMALGSDSRSVSLGALLLCDATHAACARARGDLTHHYIQIFREEKYTDLLLTCSMRLLPAEVLLFALDNNSTQSMPDRLVELFTESRQFSIDEPESGCCSGAGDIGALACRGVFLSLAGPGQAAARAVWAACPPRAARALARITASAVAPRLLRDQFTRAAKRAKTLVDTEITLLPAAREAQAVHTVEDQPLRLTVTFSREHPLTPPKVQTPLVGPAAGAHWLQVYLGYQNGDLFSAVSLWTSGLGARIDRAPQCYICYCRLQPGDGVLPKVFCAQCKNKFHTACLRKWFTTSKKSNCPVCRAMF